MNATDYAVTTGGNVAATTSQRPRLLRCFLCVVFVGAWMSLGFIFKLSPNSYLVLGIPLTIAFQLAIRRQKLQALWVRDVPKFKFNLQFVTIVAILLAMPVYIFHHVLKFDAPLSSDLWMVACVTGVFAAGYALQNFNLKSAIALLQCLGTGGALVIGAMVAKVYFKHLPETTHDFYRAIHWFLLYFPVTFVIEEVTFRGALDSYIHRPGENKPWLSAFFVSALWGLWHLPIVPHQSLNVACDLIFFQSLLGIPLSFAWRKCGNLAVPCAVHALVDAIRNALGIFH